MMKSRQKLLSYKDKKKLFKILKTNSLESFKFAFNSKIEIKKFKNNKISASK